MLSKPSLHLNLNEEALGSVVCAVLMMGIKKGGMGFSTAAGTTPYEIHVQHREKQSSAPEMATEEGDKAPSGMNSGFYLCRGAIRPSRQNKKANGCEDKWM